MYHVKQGILEPLESDKKARSREEHANIHIRLLLGDPHKYKYEITQHQNSKPTT